jgi:DNA-binding response OmpR family regulator
VDLVLLDILMPGMSGYDILDALRADGLLQKVPVIALSAKVSREAIVKGMELGASDYVGKPFHRAELLCRIRVHLSLKKQRDQLAARARASGDKAPILEAVHALPGPEN